MAEVRKKQVRLVVTEDEHKRFKKVAKSRNCSVAQLCRTLITETQNKDVNDTAQAIQSLEKNIEEKLLDFAKAQDAATACIINNLCVFYESKVEKLQENIDQMLPYFEEAQRMFELHEAKKRKARAAKRREEA
jgi:transcriptional regulator of heat shock response